MRMLVIAEDSDLPALARKLLDARFSTGQADAALESLQALNPHVDLKRLAAGTVLLVPEGSVFKDSASTPVAAGAVDGLRELVRSSLAAAAGKLEAGNTSRAAERAEVAAVLDTQSFKAMAANDPQLGFQLDATIKAFREEEQRAEDLQIALGAAMNGALAELASFRKLLG
jgi:hypothetical protein